MLYTGKGDDGKTSRFGCNQRVSKGSLEAEALGAVDEINSLLGICKVKAQQWTTPGVVHMDIAGLMDEIQQNLFVVQADLGGYSDLKIGEKKVKKLETVIKGIEKELPSVKTFFVSGGTELASFFDYARTVARRAERHIVLAEESTGLELGEHTKAYLNRLSSVLYALARLVNHKAGIAEKPPKYE